MRTDAVVFALGSHRNRLQLSASNGSAPPPVAPFTLFGIPAGPGSCYCRSSPEGDDVVLVIFDVERFLRQALPHLNAVAPLSEKRLQQIEYYDAYHPPHRSLSPLVVKDMRFAYQREWLMIIDPGRREVLAAGGALFVDIGSIADIAAVYTPDGSRIAGTGPETFLA